VNLIGNTTTRTGLRIRASLDSQIYPTGIAVPDQEMAALKLEKSDFHGEWNYRIPPRLN
jgi:DDE family transposase